MACIDTTSGFIPLIFLIIFSMQAKYQQDLVLYITMPYYCAVIYLTGNNNANEIMSYVERTQIAEQSKNSFLSRSIFLSQLSDHFWFRDYIAVAELCEKHVQSNNKRLARVIQYLWEGIASLNLARKTRHLKWRIIGEDAVKNVAKFELINTWNFENKSKVGADVSHSGSYT